ncbi:hypothetical protein RhiirA4_473566 [Rhizophagus irregularis]|uniref:Uncharacterized protein n=1 Tax=Rhizophagus irregularis TaxID=588596 RepID=A0A2I1H6X8_9GLOM|nr:hypothetical protein RhiirA4_473566 [Rhizophagus irregularis]
MSKLNHDILYEIFQNLQDLININSNDPGNLNKKINYKKFLRSQFSCLFCKYFHDLHNVFPVDSKKLLKEEIYKLFISECSSIKCLNSDMACYPILKYPGANISLSSLYEIFCNNIIDQDFYYGLAQICRSIEKLHVMEIVNAKRLLRL